MARRDDQTVFFDNMQDRGLSGTQEWSELILQIDLPAGADVVVYGILHSGSGSAWFDDVRLSAAASPSSPKSAGMVTTDITEAEDIARDAAAEVTAIRIAARALAHDDVLSEPRIIAFGEFSHGSHEVDVFQVELAKSLIEHRRIDAIAFEASFVECFGVPGMVSPTFDIESNLRACQAPPKQTEAFGELFTYLKRRWNDGNPVAYFGIDTFVSREGLYPSVQEASRLLSPDSPMHSRALERTASTINLANSSLWTLQHVDSAVLQAFSTALEDAATSLASLDRVDGPNAMSLVHSIRLRSIHSLVEQAKTGLVSSKAKESRDRAMAGTLLSMINEVIPNSRVLWLTHNAHARRSNSSVLEMGVTELQVSAGELVAEVLNDQLVIVGTHPFTGQSREPVVGTVPLQSGVQSTDLPTFWPDWPTTVDYEGTAETEKYRSRYAFYEGGSGTFVELVPASQYDILVLIRRSSPALPVQSQ